ncbi:MAG: TIGR00730 family Rossman fold protein [Bryobacterales bacterium]|nr:TIGR00730 family Rossman fold protein [Bryobacterales bacterium]
MFCGSSPGQGGRYLETARSVARVLAESGLGLVYGGASVGCMGALADAMIAAGGEVTGVIPRSMREREIAHLGLTRLHIVETMHERKAMMADLSDAFVALPGAYGTLDEFFEILTWAQIGIHTKPAGLLNVDGFYDPLLAFLDRAVECGFLRQNNRELFFVESDPAVLVNRLRAHRPVVASKWSADVR